MMLKWIAAIVCIYLLASVLLKWKGQILQERMTKAFLKKMAGQMKHAAGAPFEEYEALYLALAGRTSGPDDEEFKNLPEEAQNLFIVSVLDMEVQNGGICQFFVNYGPACAERAADCLRAVGLDEMAAAYERFFRENGINPAELHEFHAETAEQFSALYKLHPYELFDDEYMKLRRTLKFEKNILEYANGHPEAFG